MRKTLAIIAICAIVIIFSCSKKYSSTSDLVTDPSTGTPIVLNANVSSSGIFRFTLGNSGTAQIVKQASHFQVSEATTDVDGSILYTYIPSANFSGSDEVSIVYATAAGATGSGCSGGTSGSASGPTSSSYYLIKFTVAGK